MAKRYPANPEWIEARLDELLTLMESKNYVGLVQRDVSVHGSIYVQVYYANPRYPNSKLANCRRTIRVSDHPSSVFPASASIYPDGVTVRDAFQSVYQYHQRFVQAKSAKSKTYTEKLSKRRPRRGGAGGFKR